MTGERTISTNQELVSADVEGLADPMQAKTGMPETAIQRSLLGVQAEPVKLRNAKPIWAARNPQNPM